MRRIVAILLLLLSQAAMSQQYLWRSFLTGTSAIPPLARTGIVFYSGFETDPVQTGPPPYAAAGFNSFIQQAYASPPNGPLVTRSQDVARVGTSSIKFVVNRAFTQTTGEGHSQITFIDKPVGLFVEGQDVWFGNAFFLPTSFVPDGIEFLRQWHHDNSNGSPPMGFASSSGRYVWDYITVENGSDQFFDLGPIVLNKWTDVVLHIIFSSTNAGLAEIWIDGAKKMTLSGPTLFTGASGTDITMFGLYKWTYKLVPPINSTTSRTLYGDEFRIAIGCGTPANCLYSVSPGNY